MTQGWGWGEVLESDGILERDVVQGLLGPLQEHRSRGRREEILGCHPLQGPSAVGASVTGSEKDRHIYFGRRHHEDLNSTADS